MVRPWKAKLRRGSALRGRVDKVMLDKAVLEASPSLRFIGIMATGTNNVDLEAARERKIVVCNARGYATNSVAQHTIGLMLNLIQQHRYIADTNANQWQESDVFCRLDYPIIELAEALELLALVSSAALLPSWVRRLA